MASYRFDRYELHSEARRLVRDGQDLAVGLRVFDLIAYLVAHRDRAVGRDELIAAVWGRVDAGEALLAQAVLKARRAFGDDGHAQHHIRTVPRFGYQWVAATQPLDCAQNEAEPAPAAAPRVGETDESSGSAPSAPPADRALVAAAAEAPARTPRRQHIAAGAAASFALLVALAAFAWQRLHAPAAPTAVPLVDGLILVAPTQVQSAVAEDGWMRLGVMALSAQALAGLPGHAVVPDETALAAAAQAGAAPDVARLRAQTGAAIVVTSEASRSGEEWTLSATVFDADGGRQIVGAQAADPVAAAGALARRLHDLLAPEAAGREDAALPPAVLALAARMRAATLEGQNGRALALAAAAPAEVAAAPDVRLLRAEALVQLGRAGEAADDLRALLDGALADPPPRWLPAAWSALGDCELALGRPDRAEAHFRRSLALGRHGDRRTTGLAWRGLGIAQAVRNDLDGAEASYLHARLELEPVGDRLILARVTDGLGYIAAQRGRLADALRLYEQAATMGSAFGANETELGSRLNVAQAQAYLLQPALALDGLRALLPRLRRLDYPALHRFGRVAYAMALAETGALTQARQELARLDADDARSPGDAVVDVRLDEARVLLAAGDAAGAVARTEAVRAGLGAQASADLRLEAAALLLQAQAGRDAAAARALAADAALWQPAHALAPARVHALVAQARWSAQQGDEAAAGERYAQAFALARGFGAPVILRDAAVPYAQFLLARGRLDEARTTAGVLGPYAEDDFACALLLARLAAARDEPATARAYFARAQALAGERWSEALAAEAAASQQPARASASR